MVKAKQNKREEKKAEEDGDYEFKLPPFDERAFIRREVNSAKASFYTLGLGALAGALALAISVTGIDWKLGWIPVLGATALLAPILKRVGFDDEVVAPKALFGSYMMLFFTALGVWLFGYNFI